jgi:hypothetical protein
MPSERAKRAAEKIDDMVESFVSGQMSHSAFRQNVVAAISSEYADLEAWAEYVERVVLCDRAQSGETMPSFLSLGELLTCPEWKKEHK